MNNALLYALAVPLLSASGGLAAVGVLGKQAVPVALGRFVAALALLASGLLLFKVLFQPDGMHFGFVLGLMCVTWLTALVAFVESFFNRVPVLDLLVFPLCALAFALPLVLGEDVAIRMAGDTLFQIHLLIALAAYSLLGIAAGHALVMAFQEKALHRPGMQSSGQRALREKLLDQLPPLMNMESILFRQLWAGFILLSLTLLTGFVFSESWLGTAGKLNHKTIFSVLSWLSFAVLLGGRMLLGWRGKVALRWCLGSYGVLFLAYFGTQFVLEFILKRVG
ncbi:cytochrome c biogenesis protein CcsA [Limnobacter humi]|uniref:Cytochrome c biogenesis protein CcsA n=1 Tax=Limnobacter humi TaxID=1778671 RepID=A0ABT1WHQ4_9BURK|nr:cytochrome c biogenesis protein CcsA [Limnobacter humi]MCQ8897041.1 cytochrome c biogenesis protein CcsA [Limnobacter humi]